MVELELGELDADAAGFVKEGQLVLGEVGRRLVDQQLCQAARILRHLDHAAVARGESRRQATKAQEDREIPRHDVPDHAHGLWNHTVAGAEEVLQVHAAPLRLHPLPQVADRVVHAVDDTVKLGKQGLVTRAVAIVGADRIQDGFTVVAQEGLQLAQVGLALLQIGIGVCQVGITL